MATSKERIKLRFKALSDGRQSLYLDYMKDGKRIREALGLHVNPDAEGKLSRSDKRIVKQAEALMADRLKELYREYGYEAQAPKSRKTILSALEDYKASLMERGSRGSSNLAVTVKRAILEFGADKAVLSDVDEDFCNRFIDFLQCGFKNRWGRQVTEGTAKAIAYLLSSFLGQAVAEGLIPTHPMKFIQLSDRFGGNGMQKVFLTMDETRRLMETPCPCFKRPHVKMAFLFACFTGLTRADVMGLRWKDIKCIGGKLTVMKHSNGNRVPLSDSACRWLPERPKGPGPVFHGLPGKTRITQIIQQWTSEAGISKAVSFQTARNTFAYLLLSSGTDFEIVASLLGNRRINAVYHLKDYINMTKQSNQVKP